MLKRSIAMLVPTLLCAGLHAEEEFLWQQPQATVTDTGNVIWTPQPFRFEAGEEIRFIDYAEGSDANDGHSQESAWKHHPWDARAEGQAAEHSGPTTYVFRRGVIYRGGLGADESGEEGQPIRLTASATDPDSPYYWGEGEALFFGSTRLPAEWVPASSVDHPERIPEPSRVWAIDLADIIELKQDQKTGTFAMQLHYAGRDRKRGQSMPYIGLFLMDEQNYRDRHFFSLHIIPRSPSLPHAIGTKPTVQL
ncbi:MAG: hypothetical protein ACOCXA_01220 [Planctomycetota bacterium]